MDIHLLTNINKTVILYFYTNAMFSPIEKKNEYIPICMKTRHLHIVYFEAIFFLSSSFCFVTELDELAEPDLLDVLELDVFLLPYELLAFSLPDE